MVLVGTGSDFCKVMHFLKFSTLLLQKSYEISRVALNIQWTAYLVSRKYPSYFG